MLLHLFLAALTMVSPRLIFSIHLYHQSWCFVQTWLLQLTRVYCKLFFVDVKTNSLHSIRRLIWLKWGIEVCRGDQMIIIFLSLCSTSWIFSTVWLCIIRNKLYNFLKDNHRQKNWKKQTSSLPLLLPWIICHPNLVFLYTNNQTIGSHSTSIINTEWSNQQLWL